MKIVYCIEGIYNSGGMERVLCNKSNWLIDNDYNVTIITTDQMGRNPFMNFNKAITCIDLGINYFEVREMSFFERQNTLWHKRRLHKKKTH